MPTVSHTSLNAATHALLAAMGSAETEAACVADHLVEANLKGHDSHGVGMIPHYVRNWQAGTLVLNRELEITRDDGAFLVADGGGGHGQVMAKELTERAIARAGETGVAVAGLTRAHHIGRVGTYGEWVADAGLVSIHFVNVAGHGPSVAPFGGSDARFMTNPVCIAVPATSRHPATILDFATSEVAMGKVRVALNEGREMPDGMLIDSAGQMTRNPGVMFPDQTGLPKGALAPMGKHKGYGLSLMAELLGAALIGGLTIPPNADQPDDGWNQGIRNNMLMIVLDPDRLSGRDPFLAEAERIIDWATASPPADPDTPVMVAGDPERAYKADRSAHGIAIDATTWAELQEAADAAGMGRDEFDRVAAPKAAQ